jgi:quercetin dioxygenase-like cupin family protein
MEKVARKRIVGERVMLSDVVLQKGCFVSTHAHVNEQFVLLLSGRMRFSIGAEDGPQNELVLGSGEVLHVPSNVPHAAEALEDSHVIDVFSPVTEGTGLDAQA